MRLRHIHVLVDLEWTPHSGGHIKCWERLAAAAARRNDIDLTLHVAGWQPRGISLSSNVRMMVHKPVFSTRRIPFLGHVPDHTDMAGFHPGLARALQDADLIHTTDAFFAYARTAEKVAAQRNIPLTTSLHTDTIAYTEIFTHSMLEKKLGPAGIFLNEAFLIPQQAARGMRKKLNKHMGKCAAVLVSRDADAALVTDKTRLGRYRLGLDFGVFNPERAMRDKLNVPADALLLAFAGRLDEGKNFYTLLDALKILHAENFPVYLLAAGIGPGAAQLPPELGRAIGFVPPAELAGIYASADYLALPSHVETWSMAAAEALACGLPVMAAKESGTGRFIEAQQAGVLVSGHTPQDWAQAIRNAPRKATMRAAAAKAAQQFPSWDQALEEDFMPVWENAL